MDHIRQKAPAAILPDDRFRKLLGNKAWQRLPAVIRARFGKRLEGGASVAYQGEVVRMEMNAAGWCLAQALRLIGAPLPYDRSAVGKPAVVVVSEDAASDGQFWIRQYGRANGFPQVVHSSKRFAGPSGLEEYIGFGIGMALNVEAEEDALYFKSDHYFMQFFGRRLRLPKILKPCDLIVGHKDLDGGNFLFSLNLHSHLFGHLMSQDAIFQGE